MKKITLIISGLFVFSSYFAQKTPIDQEGNGNTVVIQCSDFHITRPLSEIAAENPVDENMIHPKAHMESKDRKKRKPHDFPYTVEKDGPAYGNDPSSVQTKEGSVANKAPIMNFAGQTVTGFRPMDPSGAVSSTHYLQAINSTTFRVYNKSTGAILSTATVGSLWTPATANDGDPIIMYDKAADRWFISQFGSTGNKIYIAISQTNNPLGSYYTYTFTSPQFPDYLKFGVWTDGYYMTSNQAQKVFAFERTAMLAGVPTARSIYTSFSPPQGSGFFVPMPGDASDGVLPPAGTPCPIFSYSDNGWGGGFTDAVNIYKMAVNWAATPTATITSAGIVPAAAFDASYSASWDDISQPGTTQKLDGIGGIVLYRAQWKTWTGYNSVCLTWAVRISATQRSLKWCELRQNQSTGVWSLYQEGIYTPDAATRWMGGIAMDNNGAIALCYMKSDATSIYPGLYYAGRRPCDPLGTLPVAESVAIAGTGSQTGGVNRDGDYSQVVLDPDGVTFWCTSEYMGGTTGSNAARTRIYSFQLPTCGPAAPVANFVADNTAPCIGATVNFTDLSTNTPTSWAWSFSPTTITYTGGTTAASQHPKVIFNAVGPYTATLVATNASGNDSEIKTAYIAPISPGALPLVENFEGVTFPPTGWTVQNIDAPSIVWGTAGAKGLERRAAAGNTGSASGSAGIECYNYNTDTTQVDNLISKPISLVGATAPRMTFKRAYKYYNDATNPNNYHDELRVYISSDCGATYGASVYYKKGVQLASNGTVNTSFTPGVTADWDTDTVNLTSYVGQNIIVKFEVTNRYGNNLYLDDININNTAAAVASVTIASNDADNIICAGTSVIFTATPTNGGTTPIYQWQVNGSNVGTNSPTYTTTTLTSGQIVTCIMTSNLAGVTGSPATSNSITMTVNPVPATPTVTASSPVCSGATIALSTATVAGATYSWTGPSAFTSALQNPTRPAATTAMAGTYSVTVTVGGCTSAAGTAAVVVNATPAAPTATSNTPVCAGSTINLMASTVAGATYSWTGPSTFTSTTQNPTRPSATTAMAGTYSVTASVGGCTSVAGTTNVVVNAIPATPTVTASSPVCSGATITLSTATVAGATYSWTGPSAFTSALQNPTRPAATTAMAGTYSVTVTVGGCTSAAGTAAVVVNATPAAPTATSNTPVCAGSTINLMASTVAGATYSWAGPSTFTSALQNPTRPSATTAMAGTYSVTATVGGCTSVAGTTNVVVNAIPATPTVTASSPVCSGATITLSTATVTGATYSWTGPSAFTSALQNPTRPAAATAMAGTYSVTVTVGGCTSAAGTAAVVVNATPAAPTATSNTPVCSGSTINLMASTVAGATYSWTGPSTFTSALQNPTRPSATTAMAGTYSVTATVGGCTSVVGTTSVIVNATPASPTASSNSPVCAGSTINLLATTVAGATYSWTGPSAFASTTQNPTRPSATTAMAGTYSVTVTVGGCTSAAGTTNVIVNPQPTSTFTQSPNQCLSGNSFNFTNTGSSGGGYSYSWTFAGGTPGTSTLISPTGVTFSTAGPHAITHTITGTGGCVSTTTSTVTIYSGPTAQAVTTTTTACGSTTGTITVGATTGGTGPYTYSVNGSPFTTTTSYSGFGAGSYPVIVNDVNGCSFTTSASVSNSSGPTAQAITTINATCGNPNGTINLGITTGGTGPYMYSVNGSAYTGTTTYTGLVAGTYSVIVQDAGGCLFTTSAVVGNISGPTAITTTSSSTCGNPNGSAAVNVTGGTPSYLYNWSPTGATTAILNSVAAGTYTVTVTDANGCTFSTTAIVTDTPGPTAQASTITNSTCGGSDGAINLGATTGGTGPYTYSVNGSGFSATTNYSGFAAGVYPVSVTDANGCIFNTSVTVGNTGTTPATPTITQSGSVLTSSSATGNQWYLNGTPIAGATGQNYTFTANGNYTVVVTISGCSSAASAITVVTGVGVTEIVNNPYSLSIYPNPNDGHFIISFVSEDRSSYKVEIVNALGQLIYRDEVKDFTGIYKKEMSVVEYGQGIYTISLTNSKNETVKKVIVY